MGLSIGGVDRMGGGVDEVRHGGLGLKDEGSAHMNQAAESKGKSTGGRRHSCRLRNLLG